MSEREMLWQAGIDPDEDLCFDCKEFCFRVGGVFACDAQDDDDYQDREDGEEDY